MTETADVRRPGRPRSPEAHAAILRAALELAVEGGLRGLSMEAIAARAGVGKATIYRRWKSKEALFAEAIGSIALNPEVPDTGSVRGDFEAASGAAVGRMAPEAFRVLPRLMADAGDDPELLEALQRARAPAARRRSRRSCGAGSSAASCAPTSTSTSSARCSSARMVARVLMSGGDARVLEGLPMRIWDTLASGIATPSGVAGKPPAGSPSTVLTLTETAAEVVRTLVEQSEAPDSGGLSIAAHEGEVDGVELELSLVGEPEALDETVEQEGATVYLDPGAAELLDDKLLDAQVAEDHVTFVLREDETSEPLRDLRRPKRTPDAAATATGRTERRTRPAQR